MRLFLLVSLVMVAFAANSILNRMALAGGLIGPGEFAAIRLASGAALLVGLVRFRSGTGLAPMSPTGLFSLTLYVLGFSFAYVWLDSGVGALILFGGVQITMLAGAIWQGEAIARLRWVGMAVAVGGLVWLLLPGAGAPDPAGAILMSAAAVGWGVYSLHGRGAVDPLGATASNFLFAVPVGGIAALTLGGGGDVTAGGVVLAVTSGAVTSGLGYALWYAVLPRLQASTAATAQLSVPVIALVAGNILLGEALGIRTLIAAALVLGGIAVAARSSSPTPCKTPR